jgi:hypothetical protein
MVKIAESAAYFLNCDLEASAQAARAVDTSRREQGLLDSEIRWRCRQKIPELPRGRAGPKDDVRPSARECEPHKRINQEEDPSDFKHKHDPNHHRGPYTLEAFCDQNRCSLAHDVGSNWRPGK